MFLERGFVFTHEAVREWERLIAPLITQKLRKRRKGKVGNSWFVDESYVKVNGKWHYLYRAIDRDGNLVDVRLSPKRDKAAAKAFFHKALETTGVCPDRVTTDGHKPYPAAIKAELGEHVKHPNESISKQSSRTRSSRHQATLLSDAWLQIIL